MIPHKMASENAESLDVASHDASDRIAEQSSTYARLQRSLAGGTADKSAALMQNSLFPDAFGPMLQQIVSQPTTEGVYRMTAENLSSTISLCQVLSKHVVLVLCMILCWGN